MDRYVYLHHPSSLQHETGAHPEQAARIEAIEQRLSASGWLGFDRELAPPASREAIEAVHPATHVESIEQLARSGGGMADADTVVSPGSFDAALHAAGAALLAVDLLMADEAKVSFCATRPPGHHAERARAMGFCLFNNIAIAATHAGRVHGLERVLVLDWDVHHGNGTNDIFYGSDSVLYMSIHQSPLYPGSGALTESGSGAGEGYTVNMPVPPGSAATEWLGMFEQVVVPIAREYRPELVLVSAGYDAHLDDPLANCALIENDYETMAAGLRRVSDELGAPLGFVLEGGYDLGSLSRSVEATLRGAAAPDVPAAVSNAALARSAREHYARWWPSLAAA